MGCRVPPLGGVGVPPFGVWRFGVLAFGPKGLRNLAQASSQGARFMRRRSEGPSETRTLAGLALRSGGVRNITDSRQRQRRETPQDNANTTAPETIRVAPIAPRKFRRSPRNAIESNIAATTLSLSIGATFATWPSCNARK
jgi:hypothetical protein